MRSKSLPPSLTIRPAKHNDSTIIVTGINEICAEGGAFYASYFRPTGQWQKVLYNPEIVSDHLLLVAEWGGQFAGSLNLFPGESHTLSRHVVDLGIFVLRPFRRLGIGSQLMQTGINWASSKQFEKITLSVFATNVPAVRLYQQLGFQKEGCLVRQIKSDQKYIDLWLMARTLLQKDEQNE
jgi:ribosomal protein S18 acetylase RimI-like enzyme